MWSFWTFTSSKNTRYGTQMPHSVKSLYKCIPCFYNLRYWQQYRNIFSWGVGRCNHWLKQTTGLQVHMTEFNGSIMLVHTKLWHSCSGLFWKSKWGAIVVIFTKGEQHIRNASFLQSQTSICEAPPTNTFYVIRHMWLNLCSNLCFTSNLSF